MTVVRRKISKAIQDTTQILAESRVLFRESRALLREVALTAATLYGLYHVVMRLTH